MSLCEMTERDIASIIVHYQEDAKSLAEEIKNLEDGLYYKKRQMLRIQESISRFEKLKEIYKCDL